MRAKDGVGHYGETVAERHLVEAGYEVLARNWRAPEGELDLVVRKGDALVFVEVKCRSSIDFGEPSEAVGPRKARRIRLLAQRWLAETRPAYAPTIRFDVISVLRSERGAATVTHLEAAF